MLKELSLNINQLSGEWGGVERLFLLLSHPVIDAGGKHSLLKSGGKTTVHSSLLSPVNLLLQSQESVRLVRPPGSLEVEPT